METLIQRHLFAYLRPSHIEEKGTYTGSYENLLVVSSTEFHLCTLTNDSQFEAQRPIDTLTTKHRLYLSHFSNYCDEYNYTDSLGETNAARGHLSESAGSLTAHFGFLPISSQSEDDASKGSVTSASSSVANQASFAGVHETDRHRLRQQHILSSISSSHSSTNSTGQASNDSNLAAHLNRYARNSVYTSSVHGEDAGVENSEHAVGIANTATAEPQRNQIRLSGHWSEPVSSSISAFEADYAGSNGDESMEEKILDEMHHSFRARCREPMYRFQLDALDSFETWLMCLTVQRHWKPAEDSRQRATGISARPMRWERRVAEGLDRVFRTWFRPSQSTSIARPSASLGEQSTKAFDRMLASRASALGKSFSHQNSMVKLHSDEDSVDSDLIQYLESFPQSRMLEIENSGIQVKMQPHANPQADTHPALSSMSSHYYLSSSSPNFAIHTPSRVEFTFHCKNVSVNAARLVSALEEITGDAYCAQASMAGMRSRILAGRSGGSTWAPSQVFDTPFSIAQPDRWSGGGDASMAVVVLNAARD